MAIIAISFLFFFFAPNDFFSPKFLVVYKFENFFYQES